MKQTLVMRFYVRIKHRIEGLGFMYDILLSDIKGLFLKGASVQRPALKAKKNPADLTL